MSLSNSDIKFIIASSKFTIKIADSLNKMLQNLKYQTEVLFVPSDTDIPVEMLRENCIKPNEYFILLSAHFLKRIPIPNKFIIFQLEQRRPGSPVNRQVLINIHNSLFTLDYSNANITNFEKGIKEKMYYFPMPIDLVEQTNPINNKDVLTIDILFFGTQNDRRKNILNKIKSKYNIHIVDNVFGSDLYDIITTAKIILNIHCFPDSILETARLNEVLGFDKLIISEAVSDFDKENQQFYSDKVVFTDIITDSLDNISKLYDQIDYYLNNPQNYMNHIEQNKNTVNTVYTNSVTKLISILKRHNLYKENDVPKIDNIPMIISKENAPIEIAKEINPIYTNYVARSEICEYVQNTRQLYRQYMGKILCDLMQNPNHFDIDINFYTKVNKLDFPYKSDGFKHISDYGIELGLIYHPKQLDNIFPNISIFEDTNGHIYIKEYDTTGAASASTRSPTALLKTKGFAECSFADKYIEVAEFVKLNLYTKDFYWYINNIEVKESVVSDSDLLIICFIGNLEVGENLINKLIGYKQIQRFGLAICFKNSDLYNRFSEKIKSQFDNYTIFINKEYGSDIIPSLQVYNHISYILNKKFYWVIKLHTKSNINWFNETIDFLLGKTLAELIALQKQNTLSNCLNAAKFIYKDPDPNINKKILMKYDNYIDKTHFVAGTIFFSSKVVFDKVIQLIKSDYPMYFNNNLYEFNNIIYINSPVHVIERLFGFVKIDMNVEKEVVVDTNLQVNLPTQLALQIQPIQFDWISRI
jgi:hypothetical protein